MTFDAVTYSFEKSKRVCEAPAWMHRTNMSRGEAATAGEYHSPLSCGDAFGGAKPQEKAVGFVYKARGHCSGFLKKRF